MKSGRKVWELQHQTVCKVIGMAFDLEDLKKIARRFGISPTDPLMDHEFALHSTAVQLCGSDNKVARYVQKMIQKRFARYAHRLSGLEVPQLIELITESKGNPDVPLWAVLWNLSTWGLENGASVETALFGFIHVLEHRLMREYWESVTVREDKRAAEARAADEATGLKRRLLDLQSDLDRREKVNEQLRVKVAELNRSQGHALDLGNLPIPMDRQRVDQAEKTVRLQMLLDETRCRNQDLEQECSRLRTEVELLVREVSRETQDRFSVLRDTVPMECPCQECRGKKHVAMVGGIESLEIHYRELVEAMGGTFQRHDGDCRGGECPIQDCVRRADLVVCPVEVNSHNAVKSVKKLCRKYGVPCCFPRTAGLSGLRTAIAEHFPEYQVA